MCLLKILVRYVLVGSFYNYALEESAYLLSL